MDELDDLYNIGRIQFSGTDDALYDRHLLFDHVVEPAAATAREKFEAVARSLRDVLAQRWLLTERTHAERRAKRVYYLSMEFLIGRTLANNAINMGLLPVIEVACRKQGLDWTSLLEEEPDAGLGNGGLGRLAACFLDSLATLEIPAIGYGLRYDYGIFRQTIAGGWQHEEGDHWLGRPDPWEVTRLTEAVPVTLHCSFEPRGGALCAVPGKPFSILGIPHDRPIVGYGGGTVNTLRLWSAAAPEGFDFQQFSGGDFSGAIAEMLAAETFTRVLYPDDSTLAGQGLRFVQEYFLVACAIGDLIRRFRRTGAGWRELPAMAAVQLNDTHPAMAVPELMRVLLDEARLGWDEAWGVTQAVLAYTNHTLLPEALEKWPLAWFEHLLPRQLEIIYEINRRFLDHVRAAAPGDGERVRRLSLIEEDGGGRKVRMANLAVVGSHSVNGVSAIHSRLLTTTVLADFATVFPERFNNKTNGVTPRRWLLLANPALAELLTATLGESWITDLDALAGLGPLAADAAFRERFRGAKRAAKIRFAEWLIQSGGERIDPDSIFDSQVKRIHEYKRQLLNALHIVVLYNRLRENPRLDIPPRTFLFAGKAAPAYRLAKLVIKFINNLGAVVSRDPAVGGRLRVLFLPNYSVTLAERLIPASDVSEQISTAGYEASGTGNMKLMMNGALTIGTRDGATIEMAEAAGEENIFLFGLTADQVAASRGWYGPRWHYEHEPETRAALDLIASDHFSREEPGIFAPLVAALLDLGDPYMHLADLASYAAAQERLGDLYRQPEEWTRMAIRNVAASGRFSSDRTIRAYARDIWRVAPCPIARGAAYSGRSTTLRESSVAPAERRTR